MGKRAVFRVGVFATICFPAETPTLASLFNGDTVEIVGMLPGRSYRVKVRGDFIPIGERHLRAIYDGANPSTWAEFAKVTGIDLPGSCLVAKAVQTKRRERHKAR